MESNRRIYRRNLPHYLPENTPIFLTWRLAGTLPRSRGTSLENSPRLSDGERFRSLDATLDRAIAGPRWLANPKIAECVSQEIEAGESIYARYDLYEFVVMPNHVHVLLLPREEPRKLMRILKGITARKANLILGRSGHPFWQDESYDRWCRDTEEVRRIRRYIQFNPVKAGLASTPEQWKWSSAHRQDDGSSHLYVDEDS
jgi:putative transposase